MYHRLVITLTITSLIWVLFPLTTNAQTNCDYVVGKNDTFTEIGTKTTKDVLAKTPTDGWAGKTICLRNDKIHESSLGFEITVSGKSGNPLTIKAHPDNNGQKVIFRHTTNQPSCGISSESSCTDNPGIYSKVLQINGNYLNISDIKVMNSNGRGIYIGSSSFVNLSRIDVEETVSHGIMFAESTDSTLDQCTVKRAVTDCCNIVGENLIANNANRLTISNCLIEQDGSKSGGVLTVMESKNVIFRNNEMFANNSQNIHIDNGDNIVYENNLIVGVCSESVGSGLYKLNERYARNEPKTGTYPYFSSNITIKNNLIINKSKGLNFGGCQDSKTGDICPFNNISIINNTLVGTGIVNSTDENTEFSLIFANMQDSQAQNVVVKNNVFHSLNGSENDYKSSLVRSVAFQDNYWSSISGVPTAGNYQVSNWQTLFPNLSESDLTTCRNTRLTNAEIDRYQVTSNAPYQDKGANVRLVGIGRGGDNPPITITQTPGNSPTATTVSPSPTPPLPRFDTDTDTDWLDILLFLPRFGLENRPKYDLNTNGFVDIFDFASSLLHFN